MSLFDYMLYPNGKNSKNSQSRKSGGREDNNEFDQEFAEEISLTRHSTKEFLDPEQEHKKDIEKSTDERNRGSSFKEEFSESYKDDIEEGSFKEEFAEEYSDVSRYGIQSYSKAGVTFEKLSETQGRINYDGLLAKSGAQEILGVYGYGSNQKWEDVSTLSFTREGNGAYSAIVPVEPGKNINIAFKDNAENWDNNSGMNYTFVN